MKGVIFQKLKKHAKERGPPLARLLHIYGTVPNQQPALENYKSLASHIGSKRRKKMSMILNIPDKNQAQVKTVTLEASTTVDGEKKETEFSYDLPSTLEDAIAIEGTKGIFRRVINAMVIEAQGEERRKLAATSGGKERVRAKYLEQFDL